MARGPFLHTLIFLLALAARGLADEQRTLVVRETAGIRRFGYPVSAALRFDAPLSDAARFRLLEGGKPVAAQFRRLSGSSASPAVVALDFDASYLPYESRAYVVEIGAGVEPGPEPARGLKVEQAEGAFRVTNGDELAYTVPRNLAGFLRSVKTSKSELLAADAGASGLLVRLRDGASRRLGAAAGEGIPMKGRVVKEGPIQCALRFETEAADSGPPPFATTVDLEFPRSKSWVRASWNVDDPGERVVALEAIVNLELRTEPVLVDFGAGSLVYAALPRGQTAVLEAGLLPSASRPPQREPFWKTLRGPPGDLAPYVVGPLEAGAPPPEGWAHVMDQDRCTAVAVAGFARASADRIAAGASGRLEISRRFALDGVRPPSGVKTLTFWLHFVGMPPHVGAVTSPQSMQSPLEVEWGR